MSESTRLLNAYTTMARTAREAGCPQDQTLNFIQAGYIAQPKQFLFHAACRRCDMPDGPTEIAFGGARGPGKSHAMFAQMALDDCQRFDGLKCLLLRKSGRALRESAEDLRRKVLSNTSHTYNKTTGLITFKNDSRIFLGHFKNEGDIDRYVGLEYDLVGIEEATTLSGQKYRLIRTCCRTSKDDWRPRMYSNANPGGVGHQFYHRHFVQGEPGTEFIPATYKDNVFLDENYVKSLEGLTGWLRRAWLEGDWNVHAGQYFSTFRPELHVVKPFEIDQLGWVFHLAVDYGWTHPTAFLLLARDNQGGAVFVDGYAAAKRLPEAHDRMIREMLEKWHLDPSRIRAFVMGTDAWRPNEKGVTVADTYKKLGWRPIAAQMGRVAGATEILRRLGDEDAGIAPTLRIFSTCAGLIEQLPTLQHDPLNPEDVLKVDIDEEGFGGDDWYDSARYGLMLLADKRVVSFGTLQVPR